MAVIIGALLLTALLVATLVTVRVEFAPIWQENSEAKSLQQTERELVAIVGEVQRQVDNRSSAPVSLPLALGSTDGSMFGGSVVRSSAEFAPLPAASDALRVEANKLLILAANGTFSTGGAEEWQSVGGATDVTDVNQVQNLRIRLDSVDTGNDGDAVTMTLTDTNGAFAGDLRAYVTTYPSGYNVNVRTRNGAGTVLHDQGGGYFGQNAQAPLWIDTLRADYRWSNVVNAALPPFTIGLATQNVVSGGGNEDLVASYAITFTKTVNGTSVIVGGGGTEKTNYRGDFRGGQLGFETHHSQLPDARYVIEHGALVLAQTQGAVFKVEPAFHVGRVGNVTAIQFSLPALAGDAQSLSTAGTASVGLFGTGFQSFSAQAPSLVFTIPTDYPDLWTSFWTAKMQAAGLASGEYAVLAGTGSATLSVYGANTNPASTYYDLAFTFNQADIAMELRA